jgi:hypothetical protein
MTFLRRPRFANTPLRFMTSPPEVVAGAIRWGFAAASTGEVDAETEIL